MILDIYCSYIELLKKQATKRLWMFLHSNRGSEARRKVRICTNKFIKRVCWSRIRAASLVQGETVGHVWNG